MIAISRFRVPGDAASVAQFVEQAETAIAILASRPGFRSVDFGRNLDEPELWTITTRWIDVGSYRRALGGYDGKAVVAPLLSRAVDEPSAYEEHGLVGDNLGR